MNIKSHLTTAALVAVLTLTSIGCTAPLPGGSAATPGMASTPMSSMSHSPGMTMQATSSPGMAGDMGHAMGTKGMDALKDLKGKDFDIAFLSQMIAHHEGAVKMAEDTLKVAKRPETKAEAQKVVDAQTKEIAQMTDRLKTWYSVDPSPEQQSLMRDDMKEMMAMPIGDDNMFFQMMIPHHRGAIEMADMVKDHSEQAELEGMAEKIKTDQESEIVRYEELMKM